jgi:hypothetical protein
MEEVAAVAWARRIALPADVVATAMAQLESFPPGGTNSTQRDLMAGRPSELEAHMGRWSVWGKKRACRRHSIRLFIRVCCRKSAARGVSLSSQCSPAVQVRAVCRCPNACVTCAQIVRITKIGHEPEETVMSNLRIEENVLVRTVAGRALHVDIFGLDHSVGHSG